MSRHIVDKQIGYNSPLCHQLLLSSLVLLTDQMFLSAKSVRDKIYRSTWISLKYCYFTTAYYNLTPGERSWFKIVSQIPNCVRIFGFFQRIIVTNFCSGRFNTVWWVWCSWHCKNDCSVSVVFIKNSGSGQWTFMSWKDALKSHICYVLCSFALAKPSVKEKTTVCFVWMIFWGQD